MLFAQTIDEQTLADYDDGDGVSRLLLLESVYEPEAEAKARDYSELTHRVFEGDLTHATMRRRLAYAALWLFFDEQRRLSGRTVTVDEINAHMSAYLADHAADLRLFFQWRSDYDQKPINALRFMLAQMGLKLERIRAGKGGRQLAGYRLTPDILQRMERYIAQRRVTKSGIDSSIPAQLHKNISGDVSAQRFRDSEFSSCGGRGSECRE